MIGGHRFGETDVFHARRPPGIGRSSLMADQWFYTSSGQRFGPVSSEELHQQAEAGRLQGTDLVWCERMPNWVPASTVDGLVSSGNVATATLPAAATSASPLELW